LSFDDGSSPATLVGAGLYQQNMVGAGSFSLTDPSYNPIASGVLSDGTIWAAPGESGATVQFDITQLNGTAASGYLLLQGSTTFPVSLVTTNPYCGTLGLSASCTAQPYFNGIRLDWTATYEATPYSPATVTSAIPEPTTWALMLLGLAGLGLAGYRRRADSVRGLG
jgi:PEP-CTERM motif